MFLFNKEEKSPPKVYQAVQKPQEREKKERFKVL
jgi:hypothetical protein